MDTETFLVTRSRVMARLADRRQNVLDAMAERQKNKGSGGMPSVPLWLRIALNTFLPKTFGGFWPQALLTAAPFVFNLAKGATSKGRSGFSPFASVLGFFPIVKSLTKRYT